MRLRTVVLWLVVLVLLAPAVLLTTARALQPTGGAWLRIVSFTPLAIVAYAVVLLLLIVRVVVPGRTKRRWWLVAALAVAVPLVAHLWWFAPQISGANPPAAEGAQPFTVLTVNSSAGGIDALSLVAAASAAHADVLVVQEITPGELATLESGGLAEVWPHRVGEARAGVAGLMVFSRAPLSGAVPLPTVMDSWAATVALPQGEVRLLAVHAWPPTDPARWRADQAAIRAAATGADLIVGDLNATADHDTVQALADDGFRSVAELANEGWQPTWAANGERGLLGFGLPPLVQIDHVLVGARLAAGSTDTLRLDGTDHLAVVARVAFQ